MPTMAAQLNNVHLGTIIVASSLVFSSQFGATMVLHAVDKEQLSPPLQSVVPVEYYQLMKF